MTSPPYWGLRDYGVDSQIGQEETVTEYVSRILAVMAQIANVLRPDGTLWLNVGDTYRDAQLMGIPWRIAFALQDTGWKLRSEIIWHKPNPIPESVRNRPTKAHESIFLFAKSTSYYYDRDAILEDAKWERWGDQTIVKEQQGAANWIAPRAKSELQALGKKNKRDVWTIPTKTYPGAHCAPFPPALAEPCILAGSPLGGIILDPFVGSGTTVAVALKHGRSAIGIDVSRDYIEMARQRVACGNR